MRDEHGPDATLHCVPAGDTRQQYVRELADIPSYQLVATDALRRLEATRR